MKLYREILLGIGFVVVTALPLAAAESCVTTKCHATLAAAKGVTLHDPVASGDCLSCHEASNISHPGKKGGFKLTASGAALCEQCHDSMSKGKKVVHPALEDGCTGCHNPHLSKNRKLLIAAGNDLCYSCHDDKIKLKTMKNVHPIVEDSCVNCHQPHSGPEKGMLPARGDQLCATCHAKEATLATTAVSRHEAVTDGGCAACHDPHGSGQVKMLIEAQGTLCLGCHDSIQAQIANAKSQHQPVQDGECVACHNPHGAAFKPLLNAAFPQSFYAGYNTEIYALCFSCHPKGLAEFTRTTLTKFSNGNRNLHELHINKSDKGRTCRVCHSVHGADQERLVRSTSPSFGKWAIPINLSVTETGGTCIVGCHKPKSYDRYRPVSYQ